MILKQIILYISLIYLTSKVDTLEVYTKEWILDQELSSTLFAIPPSLIKDKVFTYQEIHRTYTNELKTTINYELFHKNNIVYHYKCHFKLITTGRISNPSISSQVGNKIWIMYTEMKNIVKNIESILVYHRVIDMINCKYHENKVRVLLQYDNEKEILKDIVRVNPFIIPFNDGSYNIFFSDKNICNAARCRYFIDKSGIVSSRFDPYLPVKYSLDNIEFYPTALDNHYFAVVTFFVPYAMIPDKETHYNLTLLYAKSGLEIVELLKLDDKKRISYIDSSNGYMTVCWTSENSSSNVIMHVHCLQYNSEIIKTIDTIIDLSYQTYSLRIKNLPESGFILLTEECIMYPSSESKNYSPDSCNDGRIYYLRYVNSKGYFNPIIEMEGANLSKFIVINKLELSYDNDDENVCVTYVTEEQIDGISTKVKKRFTKTCFPADNLIPKDGNVHLIGWNQEERFN